jgi:uncharacterized membrane protein YjjP (DUF1212 family)
MQGTISIMAFLDTNSLRAAAATGPRPPRAETRFLLALARALHRAGTPSYRLEEALQACAQAWGRRAEFFSTPTSLFAAFGDGPAQRTFLQRVRPGDADLGRVAELDELMDEVAGGDRPPESGLRRLEEIESAPPRYGRRPIVASFALVSAAAAVFFGGAPLDVLVSGLLGLLLGTIGIAPMRPGLFEPVAAFLASSLSVLLAWSVPGLSDRVTTLAALIVLVPGLMLTVGLAELSMTHWMSGTARLAGAATVFLSIAIGVALGRRVGVFLPDFASVDAAGPPPGLALGIALVVAPLAFVVLFQARRRDAGWILLAGILGFVGARSGAMLLGPELGSFVGALVVGIAGNAYARLKRRPASVLQVPALLMLVPGSIGFESLSSFVAQDVLEGVDAAFRMLFVGASLVGGLIVSNALVPPGRSL